METDTLQSKRKTEDNDGGENKKSKQEAVNVKQNFGRWIINQDLKLCLEKSVPIVAYSAKMDYRFDPPN